HFCNSLTQGQEASCHFLMARRLMKRNGRPKQADGYTMIFNELLEALMCADIPKRARRLIDVQMRFSFGCGPKTFTALTKSEYAALAVLDWLYANRTSIPSISSRS
ncbi:MAG: hypothetical protein E4H36_14080, partial [Spirochaetales bacterium]